MSNFGKWLVFDTEEICEEGFAALDRKDYADAAEAFEICISESGRESTVKTARFHLAECYSQLAEEAFHRAKYERARSDIERSFMLAQPSPERYLLAVRIARRLAEPEEAARHLDSALEKSPNHPQLLALQTASLYEEGRMDEALVRSHAMEQSDARLAKFREAHARGDQTAAVGHLLALAAGPAAYLT